MEKKTNLTKLTMIIMVLVVFIAFGATPALCGDTNAAPEGQESTGDIQRPLPDFGTASFVSYSIAPCEFVGYNSTLDNDIWGYGMNRYMINGGTLNTGAHLPTGAKIIGWELDYYDAGAGSVGLNVMYCPYNASGCTALASKTYSSGSSGYGWVQKTGLNHTVDNFDNSYLVEVILSAGSSYMLVGAHVWYQLQISPAPTFPSFSDVFPWDWYYQGVEALAASGITIGCGGGAFCPNVPVTRGQMAVFLARALGLHWPG